MPTSSAACINVAKRSSVRAPTISSVASAPFARASTSWYSSMMKSLRRTGIGFAAACATATVRPQIIERTLKKRLVGEHRDGIRPEIGVTRRNIRHFELGWKATSGWRGSLDLRDQRKPRTAQGRAKTDRGCGIRQRVHATHRWTSPACVWHTSMARLRDDPIENRAGFERSVSRGSVASGGRFLRNRTVRCSDQTIERGCRRPGIERLARDLDSFRNRIGPSRRHRCRLRH